MTDRELLEWAAKAAGKEGGYLFRAGGSKGSGFPYHIEGFQLIGGAMWNPLTNDGDALRLAVKLGLTISICTNPKASASRKYQTAIWAYGTPQFHEPHSTDPCAATRRAITRAAAEIGKML